MFHSVRASDAQTNALVFEGSPTDLAEMFESCDGGDVTFYIGGLQVADVDLAQHDGKSATRFDLAFAPTGRSIGRLVVQDLPHLDPEGAFIWEAYYVTPQEAAENLEIWTARKRRPLTVRTSVDCVLEGEPLEYVMARVSARFGIACTLKREFGPAGGNPELWLSGLTANVETALREYWNCDDDEISMLLDD
jgi:hypothetical protein